MRKALLLVLGLLAITVILLNTVTVPVGDSAPSAASGQPVPVLRFGVVSDIHVQSSDSTAQQKFRVMLRDMAQNLHPEALIINGDLGNGAPRDYATITKLVQAQPDLPPIYYTIGNHEYYRAYENPVNDAWRPATFPNGETEVAAINRFLTFAGRKTIYFDQSVKGYHFIMLGSEKSAISGPAYADKAFLSDEQLRWLQLQLQEDYNPGKPIFVFLHQPLSLPNSSIKLNLVVQADRLRAILEQYPDVIYFSGHMHRSLGQPATLQTDGFTMVNDSSVALPRGINGHPLPGQSEGLIVEVYRKDIIRGFGNRLGITAEPEETVLIKGRDFVHQTWIPAAQYKLNF